MSTFLPFRTKCYTGKMLIAYFGISVNGVIFYLFLSFNNFRKWIKHMQSYIFSEIINVSNHEIDLIVFMSFLTSDNTTILFKISYIFKIIYTGIYNWDVD